KAQSQEEFKAFQAIETESNVTNKVTLSDQFLTTYPNSQLTGFIQRFRMESLSRMGKYKESAAAGEIALNFETKYLEGLLAKADEQAKNAKDKKNKDKDKNKDELIIDKNSDAFKAFVDSTEKAMMYYYQNLMNDYQALNDAPKTIEWAEKALGEQPD